MLNTYIKNKGNTQTIFYDNNRGHFNQTNWDTEYDGNNVNISLYTNVDGKSEQMNVTLDNNDLAKILTYPSIDIPIDKRLKYDYTDLITNKPKYFDTPKTLKNNIKSYISSPRNSEEFIIPVKMNNFNVTSTRNRKHKTYKVYKKHKPISNSKRSRKSSSSKRKQTRENKKTTRYSI